VDSQIGKGLIREEISVIIALRCIVVSAVDFMSLNLCLNGTRLCAFLLLSTLFSGTNFENLFKWINPYRLTSVVILVLCILVVW
jgi:hypothetical protein